MGDNDLVLLLTPSVTLEHIHNIDITDNQAVSPGAHRTMV